MELFYLDECFTTRQLFNEYFYFMLNYIIGDKILYHSNMSMYMYYYKNLNKMNDSEMMKLFENYIIRHYVPENTSKLDEILSGVDFAKERIIEAKQMKRQKILANNELKIMQLYNEKIGVYKKTLLASITNFLEESALIKFVDLYKDDVFQTSCTFWNRKMEPVDSGECEKIYKNFRYRNKMFVLDDGDGFFKDFSEIKEITNKNNDKKRDSSHVGWPLFSVPCSKEITANDLLSIRRFFQKKLKVLFSKINNLKMEVNEMIFTSALIDKITFFINSLEVELDNLQVEIDNNFYFQKIINSDPDYVNVEVNIAVMSNEHILNYMSMKQIISIDKNIEIKRRLYSYFRRDLCEVYLYYKIPVNPKKVKNSQTNSK